MSFNFDSLTSTEKVSAAYIAYYGRAADVEGRDFWADQLEAAGGSLDAIIDAFGNSDEADQRYGSRDTADAITALYQDLFGRSPDASGLAFYTQELEAGRITLQSLALDVLNGATGSDGELISNRLETANAVTDAFVTADGEIGAGFARLVVGAVTDSDTGLSTTTEWLNRLGESDPVFSGIGTVLADGEAIDALPQSAASLVVGGSGSAGLLDLNETGTSGMPTLVLNGPDGGTLRLGGDELGAMLRVDGGRVTTEGAGNRINVGESGPAIALVEDGSTLSTVDLRVGDNARGEMILTGAGTTATVSSVNGETSRGDNGFVSIGDQDYGRLTLADGAKLEILTRDDDTNGAGLTLGENAAGQGELIVDNATVELRDTDGVVGEYGPYANIGRDGTGRMELRNEAELILSASQTNLLVGNPLESTDGSGILSISDDAVVQLITAEANAGSTKDGDLGHVLNIGDGGATGSVGITDGGLLQIIGRNDSAELLLGTGSESKGTITVSGSGSRLEVRNDNSDAERGLILVGVNDEGSLVAKDGATVQAEVVVIGDSKGGKGDLSVAGTGTTVSIKGLGTIDSVENDKVGGFLVVGQLDGSEGIARISDGASVTISKDDGIYTGMQVGNNAGSTGVLTVEGESSELRIQSNGEVLSYETAFVEIGSAGSGTLNILDGGKVVNDPLGVFMVGEEAQSNGKVLVSGAGSVLDAGGLLFISGSSEADDIDRDALELSVGGQAEVVVGAGATLRAGEAQGDGIDDIFIGENGTLRVEDGGIVEADVVNDAGGSFITGNSPGWAQISGDFDWSGELAMEFASAGRGDYDRLDITGEAILAGVITLDFSWDDGLAAGDRFTVIEATEGLDMSAAEFEVIGLSGGLGAQTQVSETSLQVELI